MKHKELFKEEESFTHKNFDSHKTLSFERKIRRFRAQDRQKASKQSWSKQNLVFDVTEKLTKRIKTENMIE